ncbi:MAG: alpha/beta hydrolase, partial [Bdellovibrionota bacterium]
ADWWIVSWMLPPALRVTNREILPLKAELSAMLPLWPKITQNVSVVQGEVDDLVPAANADFARKQLVNAAALNVVLIPKMNHFLPWKQYSLVKEEILKHL